jgi:hypothetical protein
MNFSIPYSSDGEPLAPTKVSASTGDNRCIPYQIWSHLKIQQVHQAAVLFREVRF